MKKYLLASLLMLALKSISADPTPPYSVQQPNISENFQDTYNELGSRVRYQDPTRSLNVKDFGAKGDGITDDSQVIISAIGTGGNEVVFPPGVYAIGSAGDGYGIHIKYSSTTLRFMAGAILKPIAGVSCITINRVAGSTITNVGIFGARINNTDTTIACSGITIAPDGTTATHVIIDDFNINGMTVYGIVAPGHSAGVDDLRISNGGIYNNGSPTNNFQSQALILNCRDGTKRLTIENVYAEEIANPYSGISETDGCKIQHTIDAKITNFHVKGGGSTIVTGNTMVFNDNTDLVGSNLIIEGTGGGGWQLDTSAIGNNEFSNIISTGSFGSDYAIYLGGFGSNHLKIRGLKTSFQIAGANNGHHTKMEIYDSTIDEGIRLENADVSTSIIKGCSFKSLTWLSGNSNIFDANNCFSSSGGSFRVTGSSTTFIRNSSYDANGYAITIAGNNNIVVDNIALRNVSGLVSIGSGSANQIGVNYGQTDVSDSGTGTAILGMNFGSLANGSGVGIGLLNNAPQAGNPVKWMKINDNGVIRYIPTW